MCLSALPQTHGSGHLCRPGKLAELDGSGGRRQRSVGGTSRMSREAQIRICERLGAKFPGMMGASGATMT